MSSETEPSPCPECGFERVECGLGPVRVTRSIWSGTGSTLKALVCTSCGHTTIYAKEVWKLRKRRPDTPVSEQEDQGKPE